MIQVLFSCTASSLVLFHDGNALPIGLSDVIKLMINEINSDSCTVEAL